MSSVFTALFLVLELQAPWKRDTKPVDQLLVVGGGSNCGQIGVQLAKLAGISNITVVGGDEKLLKSLGATHVIDRHGSEDDVVKQVRGVVGDDLLYAFDTVNLPDGLGVALRSLSSSKQGKLARLLPLREISKDMAGGHQVLDVLGMSTKPICNCWLFRTNRLKGINTGTIHLELKCSDGCLNISKLA